MSFIHTGWDSRTGARDPLQSSRAWLKTAQAVTILVVDDDALVGDMYRLGLVRAGYNVLVAKDGPTGLQMAAASAPALIFLDMRMPRMDGIEVLERLMADDATRRIPVVMLSNYDDSAHVKKTLGLGAKENIVNVNNRPAVLATVAARWINRAV